MSNDEDSPAEKFSLISCSVNSIEIIQRNFDKAKPKSSFIDFTIDYKKFSIRKLSSL